MARSEQSVQRFYSMSAQIRAERKTYYDMLEKMQRNGLDITEWLEWFLGCLDRAFDDTEATLGGVLRKARFWEVHRFTPLNDRQREMVNRLLDGFEGKLTSSKWAKITKCSQDTAFRDILDLVNRGILSKDAAVAAARVIRWCSRRMNNRRDTMKEVVPVKESFHSFSTVRV